MMGNRRQVMLSGVLLAVAALQGCNTISNTFRDWTGQTRTLPDNDTVDFSNRHSPALNPGGGGDSGMNNGASGANNSGRRVPLENAASIQQANPSDAAPVAPVNTASVPGTYPPLTSVPAKPAHSTTADNQAAFKAMTSEQATSETSRQSLMNDSTATVMTSPQTGQLVADATNAPLPPAAPVSAPAPVSASVNNAPAQAPLPAAMTASAPAPQAPANDSGFTAWLHRNVGGGNTTGNTANSTAANAPVRQTPVENQAAMNPPSPAAAGNMSAPRSLMADSAMTVPPAIPPAPEMPPAAMEPVHLHPPGSAMVSPAADNNMPMASAPMPVPAMEPVHLHPPGTAASSPAASSPAMSMAAPAPSFNPPSSLEPVHLHPPADDGGASTVGGPVVSGYSSYSAPSANGSGTRYLSDSRYAERRAFVPADNASDY